MAATTDSCRAPAPARASRESLVAETPRREREGGLRRAALLAVLLGGCSGGHHESPAFEVTGGAPERAPALIRQYGCGTCHRIPGVEGARGEVGPPLRHFAERAYVAGVLPNTPANLLHWIRNPQSVVPGSAMPEMGVTEQDARDIAAYLYTLR